MTVSRRIALPYAAGLCAALALAGCTGGTPDPPATSGTTGTGTTTSSAPTTSVTTTTATSAPTTSVDPVLAKIPAAARPETMAGAEAFAKFYVAQINIAFSKPDSAVFDGLYQMGCKTCQTYKATAEDFVRKERRQSGELLKITEATASRFDSNNRTVNVFFEQRSVKILDSNGTEVSTTSSGSGAFVFTLAFESGHWTVTNLRAAA